MCLRIVKHAHWMGVVCLLSVCAQAPLAGASEAVPEPANYRTNNYLSPVPSTLRGGSVLTADEAADLCVVVQDDDLDSFLLALAPEEGEQPIRGRVRVEDRDPPPVGAPRHAAVSLQARVPGAGGRQAREPDRPRSAGRAAQRSGLLHHGARRRRVVRRLRPG